MVMMRFVGVFALYALFTNAALAGQAHAPPKEFARNRFPLAVVRDTCVPLRVQLQRETDPRACRVTSFDEVGRVNGRVVYFANYCTVDDFTECLEEMGLFERVPSEESVSLISVIENTDPPRRIDPPELIHNPAGTILNVPAQMGSHNHGEQFLHHRGQWERLDSGSWLADLDQRLPAGRYIVRGIWPDLRSMTAETGLWRDGDGGCCPSGIARIQLEIKDLRLVIKSLEIDLP